MNYLRNLPVQEPKALAGLIDIAPGRVVSMALSRSEHCIMTLLAFADGESVSEEQYLGDTVYYVLEGTMPISLESRQVSVAAGQCFLVPGGTPHAVGGTEPFKLLQITVQD